MVYDVDAVLQKASRMVLTLGNCDVHLAINDSGLGSGLKRLAVYAHKAYSR